LTKHIFVLSASLSGLGKGIISASLAHIIKSCGYTVTIQKFDPYYNISASNINPESHGESIPLKDGWTGDMDLLNYANFLNDPYLLEKNNSITSGVIYDNILTNEKQGKYLGETIQMIPHITNEIKRYIKLFNNQYDIVIHEIGGNIKDIEALPYIESIRQLQYELSVNNCLICLLVYLPFLQTTQEIKTKIAQQGVESCKSLGINPDILICRADQDFDDAIKNKLSLFTNIKSKFIIKNLNANSIYYVPSMLIKENIIPALEYKLKLKFNYQDDPWNNIIFNQCDNTVTIGIVGKYLKLKDSYISITEALRFAGWKNNVNINIKWINAEAVNINELSESDGILIPGGFGSRGFEGKILAAKYARENNIPCLGICFGAQAMFVEFARNVLNLSDANSEEIISETKQSSNNLIVHLMEQQRNLTEMCQTLRLGDYICKLEKNSQIYNIYKKDVINIRHRHRYEFNNQYRELFTNYGMKIVGTSSYNKNDNDNELVEIIEYDKNKFYIGIQGHPELLSTPINSEPLFDAFIRSTLV